ncbi:MAG: CHC2 zinc finger domain-containing protein [Limisphaerales bacterium]
MKTDFNQIKRTTDIVRVVESYGVKLRKVGRNHVGRCCFHADKNPSLIVTPDKGLFHCPACGAAGNVIQFVAKKEGIGEREAAVKLLGSVPGVRPASAVAAPAPKAQLSPGESAKLLQRVAAFYARTLFKDRAGLDYLKSRKLDDPAMLEVFQVGYSNGTLPGVLPKSGEIIDGLKALGVLNERGQEHFRGCVTVPIFDSQGNIAGIYGRRITNAEPHHLYLPGPHRGVWNGMAAKTNQTLFITEAIFDGMSLWQAGFKNVIALYGTNGWTADHEQLLRDNGTTEIYLCLDNDEAGRAGTERLKVEILPPLVKQIHVVQWPEGAKDAADFFLSREPKDFETLVKAVTPDTATAPVSELTAAAGEEKIEMTPDGFAASYGPRRYELRAIERPNAARLRASVKVVHEGRFHIDMVDFYLSRSRRVFIGEAARLFRETADVIEADVNRLIGQLETYAQKQLAGAISQVVLVNDAEKAEALKLGRHADLVAEILRDLEKLGLVGELTNKLMGYLVMTSRKMDDPLALLILSGSGAGKSLLQDALLRLCPDEDLVKLTSLSDRALFYKGEDSLKNKVLAVEEVAGAEGAYYAIRNLISAKKLTIETTVKNALTGQLTTQVNTVNGPTAVFQTTTQPDLDAETKSRFIITSIDESPGQTRAILAAQRQSHTLEGLRRKQQREAIVRRHHAFQRLLQPLLVVNPFEPLLTYAEDRLLVRRDNPKYLHLILVVTFLHQLQRPARHDDALGDYIEATLDDIAIANELAAALFGQSLDELSRPGRELLQLIFDYVQGQAAKLKTTGEKIAFGRRELREALKWSEYQLRTYLHELETLEYIWPLAGRQGQPFRYRLLWDGQGENGGRFLAGLKSVEQLRREAERLGFVAGETTSSRKIQLRGEKRNFEGTSLTGSHEVKPEAKADEQRRLSQPLPNFVPFGGEHIPALCKNGGNGSRVSVTAGGRP